MHKAIDRARVAEAGVAAEPVCAAWAALKRHLEARSAGLSAEIRNYPTPIAHCDEQLTKLIDQRASALNLLKRMNDATPTDPMRGSCPSHADARRFVNSYPRGDDDVEMQSVARLKAALSQLHGNCH